MCLFDSGCKNEGQDFFVMRRRWKFSGRQEWESKFLSVQVDFHKKSIEIMLLQLFIPVYIFRS